MEEIVVEDSGTKKKLLIWGGWKKELLWILITIAILFMGYTYKIEMERFSMVINHACDICHNQSGQGYIDNEGIYHAYVDYFEKSSVGDYSGG